MSTGVGGQDKTEKMLDELVTGQRELLTTLKSQVSKWDDKILGVKEEYKELKIAALKNAGKRIEADRFAKGVPIISTGVVSAAVAFKKKDYFAGSAAIMDICSGIAYLNVPPYGIGVGLFFNTISQALSYFVAQEPPLEDKIEKMLEHLKAGQQKENIAAVGHSIASYTDSLRTKCVGTTSSKGIAAILAMPLTSESQADDFIVEMKGLQWGLEGDKVTFSVPAFANWQVGGYLENKDNQRAEGWPEVLGIWCRTYIDLRTANMMLNCLADPNTLDRLINETQETNENSLPNLTKHTKGKCHTALLNLKSLVSKLPGSWESDRKEMFKIVQAVRPAAQERGMYAHVGYWDAYHDLHGGDILYTASGSGSKDALKWEYKNNTTGLKRISIHIPTAEKDSFTPKYEVFTCEYDNKIGRHTLDSVKNDLSGRTHLISAPAGETFVDVSAMALIDPGAPSTQPKAVTFVTLINEKISENRTVAANNYVSFYEIDKDNKSTKVLWQPLLTGAKDVRNVYLPPTTLPDDPDADAMVDNNAKPPGPPLLAQNKYSFLSYAGVRNGNNIYVGTTTTGMQTTYGTVEGPENWDSYNGIEVDPYYLWVFGKGLTGKYLRRQGIACATHASIIKCRQGKIPRPTWIYHDFEENMWYHETLPVVTSLCPCADGTLVANIGGNIYTTDYEIKLASRRIVTSSWVKRGGNAKQVIKMPIPCWSMLESLRANLQPG